MTTRREFIRILTGTVIAISLPMGLLSNGQSIDSKSIDIGTEPCLKIFTKDNELLTNIPLIIQDNTLSGNGDITLTGVATHYVIYDSHGKFLFKGSFDIPNNVNARNIITIPHINLMRGSRFYFN